MNDWPTWEALAVTEVRRILNQLPEPLRERAVSVPVVCEARPSPGLASDGVGSDTLGLFVGESWVEEGVTSAPLPPQILLFLENLADYAEADEAMFREEVRKTYLHELGHFLGLDEGELTDRGLE